MVWRSGTTKGTNGEAVVAVRVIGRVDTACAAKVETVGIDAIRNWCRRPVVAVVAGVVEQVGGILVDDDR